MGLALLRAYLHPCTHTPIPTTTRHNRAYIDSVQAAADNSPESQFGLFYLDYCGRLSAGKGNVELSPVEDLKVGPRSAVLWSGLVVDRGALDGRTLCM